MIDEPTVRLALAPVLTPHGAGGTAASAAITNVVVQGDTIALSIDCAAAEPSAREHLRRQAEDAVGALPGVASVFVEVRQAAPGSPDAHAHHHHHAHAPAHTQGGVAKPAQHPDDPAATAKHVIAVGAGKGGVGKSTIAVSLAQGLAQKGYRVGLADMDLFGPSVPILLGIRDARPEVIELPPASPGAEPVMRLKPVETRGLKVVSIAFFLEDPDQPVIWRGPMIHSAVRQFLGDVLWGELDYLLIDLPPGTGDVGLSLAQSISVTGAVVVSTPQEVALADVRKAVSMYEKLGIPVLGVVENMSFYRNPVNGEPEYLFGKSGARQMAEKAGVRFLGEVPIDTNIRTGADEGRTVLDEGDSTRESVQALRGIVDNLVAAVEQRVQTAPPTERIQTQR